MSLCGCHQCCQYARIILVLAWRYWNVCRHKNRPFWTGPSSLKWAAGHMLVNLSAPQQQPYVHLFELLILMCNSSLRLKASIFCNQLPERQRMQSARTVCLFSQLWRIIYILPVFRNTTSRGQFLPKLGWRRDSKRMARGRVVLWRGMTTLGMGRGILLHPPTPWLGCACPCMLFCPYVLILSLISKPNFQNVRLTWGCLVWSKFQFQ
jgi:hypothetical protein